MAIRELTVEEQRRRALEAPPLRVAPPAPQQRRPLTEAERRSKRAGSVLALLGLLMLAGVVFGLVLVNIALAQSSFELSDLQKQSSQQESRQRELRYEIARAESPQRVAEVGAQLGLVVPSEAREIQGPPAVVEQLPKPDAASAGYEIAPARP